MQGANAEDYGNIEDIYSPRSRRGVVFMFRKICANDKEIYFEMSREFYSSGAALKPIGDDKRERVWEALSQGDGVLGYIIEADGETAGYALTVPYFSQEAGGKILWVDELFVLPKFRGRGIAKEFFKFSEGLSGYAALRLEAEPDNERAIKLYKSLGFKPLPYLQMIKTSEDNK